MSRGSCWGALLRGQPIGYGQPVTRCDTLRYVADGLWWREQDAEYIRRRSVRYPGAIGIELEWTVEAAADPRRIVRDPDPKSRSSAIRVIGYSPSPGFVITVIATRSDHAASQRERPPAPTCASTKGRADHDQD